MTVQVNLQEDGLNLKLGTPNQDLVEKSVRKECFLEISNIFLLAFSRFVENKKLYWNLTYWRFTTREGGPTHVPKGYFWLSDRSFVKNFWGSS